MYSNYLTEVGKLVFLIGEIESTSTIKKLLDTNRKGKIFFKCLDELPPHSFNKIKCETRRKGIIKSDWFNKILDRSPMMIMMVFDYTHPFDKIQKWEDRLNITARKINKAVDILRSSNKEETIFRIIIIISKEVVLQSREVGQTVNIMQKINSYLKAYEKDLFIIQSDLLTKQISKNEKAWFDLLERAYKLKFRTISKRKEQSQSERRLGCIVKSSIIAEIIDRKQSLQNYDEAYKAVQLRFLQLMKSRMDPLNFDPIRQIRSVADIVFLRMLIVKITYSNSPVALEKIPDQINRHLKFFFQKSAPHYFFEYENLLWRQNFLQNLLEVVHIHDHITFISKHFFNQLINGSIDLAYRLSCTNIDLQKKLDNQPIKGRLIPIEQSLFIGSRNYTLGVEITDTDIVWTEMNDLIEKRKDFITKGLQNISRYKAMKNYQENQLTFLNGYLMRFYICDEKFGSADTLSKILALKKLKNHDYFFLNGILKEISIQPNRTNEQLIKIYGVGTLLSDFFNNQSELHKYSKLFINQCQKSGGRKIRPQVYLLEEEIISSVNEESVDENFHLILPLQGCSKVLRVSVSLPEKLHPIEESLNIRVCFESDIGSQLSKLGTFIMQISFNHQQMNKKQEIDLSKDHEFTLSINPLEYLNKDQTLTISHITFKSTHHSYLVFLLQKINFPQFSEITFFTKLQPPEIKINIPYETYYINEVSKFTIEISKVDQSIKIDAAFMIDEDQLADKTEIFSSCHDKMNLCNSKRSTPLQNGVHNIIYMKCNKLGHKLLKFTFNIVISQKIGEKALMNSYKITKQFAFKVANLFKSLKIIKESFTGNQLKSSEIPPNKKILLNYCLRSTEMINILELGQHKSPKESIKFHKELKKLTNMIIHPEEKLKNVVIFQVNKDLVPPQQKQIFVISFYAKWARMDLNYKLGINDEQNPCENLYIQNELKVGLLSDQIEVEYEEGIFLNKFTKQSLSIKYRNLTDQQVVVYALMDNSDSIMRIGHRSSNMKVGPRQTRELKFDILPIKSGYHPYPNIRHFFDGVEATQKAYKNYLCVI